MNVEEIILNLLEEESEIDDSQKMAIEMYGKEHQTMIAIEEMSELTKEISKEYRGQENIDKITEEIADVYICLEQLQMIYGIENEDLDEMIQKKMERNYNRMIEELLEKWREN